MRPEIPNFPKDDLYALYPFGSRVYGTVHPKSDWDFIAVKGKVRLGEMSNGLVNIRYYTPEQFQALLKSHHISALECHFLPRDRWYSETIIEPDEPWKFELHLPTLRRSLSEKASHSWVKAKKKFVSPYDRKNELLRGKKSLFHSFRIISYGIQIATLRTIFGYDEVNWIFREIMEDPSEDWAHYEEVWKPRHNEMMSAFRKAAPKE